MTAAPLSTDILVRPVVLYRVEASEMTVKAPAMPEPCPTLSTVSVSM